MDKLFDTPIKAIRKKCINCSYSQLKEIRSCTVIDCAIYPYRFGRRPDANTIQQLEEYYSKKAK